MSLALPWIQRRHGGIERRQIALRRQRCLRRARSRRCLWQKPSKEAGKVSLSARAQGGGRCRRPERRLRLPVGRGPGRKRASRAALRADTTPAKQAR